MSGSGIHRIKEAHLTASMFLLLDATMCSLKSSLSSWGTCSRFQSCWIFSLRLSQVASFSAFFSSSCGINMVDSSSSERSLNFQMNIKNFQKFSSRKKKPSCLTKEQFERRDIVSGKAEGVLIFTDDIFLEARLWDVVQILHDLHDLLPELRELCVSPRLSGRQNGHFVKVWLNRLRTVWFFVR